MRKKIDSRIRTLVENGVQLRHRTFFVVVGDRGREQVVNLHYMLTKSQSKTRPTVLWCYKKDLGFTTHKQKRMKEIKQKIQRGQLDPEKDDPFELFISSTDIRYTYYTDTHKILGNTYGMCVLQDFEAVTPNLLARTIETVEGGGIVVLLLRTMKSLRQLYSMTMEVHHRFRTESHQDVEPRFNERFILSLASCENCLVVDDTLNVLPISSHCLSIAPVAHQAESLEDSKRAAELRDLKVSLADTQPAGALVSTARTMDQAKAILTFIESISEKTLRSTVTLTAARGRGKSAALGIAIASAVAYGYSNIFVTSPSPENLKTLFDFIFKGFDALDYQEHTHYELVQSTNPEFNKAIVRVNIFRQHRQTIQYIQPNDAHKLGQAELVVIDEAAAIPLPLVKKLLGPYLVFMASTINGYEGTGRSLSLKLIQQLRKQSSAVSQTKADSDGTTTAGGRVLREITLSEPIRYAVGDPIEKWLHRLLCLDAVVTARGTSALPDPSKCELYHINRDTLFSFHRASEDFLQRLMALYVSSHYKNTPNDLQLMSDAPAHQLFCLLGPVDPKQNSLPEILCVIQVCLEGEISKQSVVNSLARGVRASGDLIPWTVSQQFQDNDFAALSGARIVRIATHPDYSRMGYGTRSMELLSKYYRGEIVDVSDGPAAAPKSHEKHKKDDFATAGAEVDLLSEELKPKDNKAPLLSRLNERPPERLHYLGVSYGLTRDLFRFWKNNGFTPVYLRQTSNDLTGEHTCIMLKELPADDLSIHVPSGWLTTYWKDFRKRFCALLSYSFRDFAPSLAVMILERAGETSLITASDAKDLSKEDVDRYFSPYDLKRLETYSRNLIDYHVILDLIPLIARLWFDRQVKVGLSAVQCVILLATGLQCKSIDALETDLELPASQIMALFNKCVRKITTVLRGTVEADIAQTLPGIGASRKNDDIAPLRQSLDDDLDEGSRGVNEELHKKQQALIKSMDLSEFAIATQDEDWEKALGDTQGVPSNLSVKGTKKQKRLAAEAERNEDAKRMRAEEAAKESNALVKLKKKKKQDKSNKHH